jgi:hypothetical protein
MAPQVPRHAIIDMSISGERLNPHSELGRDQDRGRGVRKSSQVLRQIANLWES